MLRRFRQHFAKQNWMALGFDFVIVVVGVFLGLQAQDWNQDRVDRQLERTYHERLKSDFEAISRSLEGCMNTYARGLVALDHVAAAVLSADATPAESEDGADIRESLVRMTAGTVPAGRSVTFVEMLSSGNLRILRNESLRRELIHYDQLAEAHREIRRSLQRQTADYGHPVYSAITLSVDLEKDPMVDIGDFDLDAMAESGDFRTMITVFKGNNANAYELCERQLGFASDVLAKLGETS